MDLLTYWKNLDAKGRTRWAKRSGTNTAYLRQIVYGHRLASPELSKSIHEASDTEVPLAKIRPDIWSAVAA